MRKITKLVLGLSLLAGSLTLGAAPKVADAASICPTYCCDAACYSIRPCYFAGGRCICSQYCQPAGPILD